MQTEKTFSALTLIEKVVDFESMISSKITFEEIKQNPPRFVRLQEIMALNLAFIGKPFEIENWKEAFVFLKSGMFLNAKDAENYQNVFDFMDNYLASQNKFPRFRFEWSIMKLQFHYNILFQTFEKVYDLKTINSGNISSSFPFKFAMILNKDIGTKLETSNLDTFLSLVISPAQQTFSLDEMISKYGYPKTDLSKIDMDYL